MPESTEMYDMIDYQEDALRTESPVTPELVKRMQIAHDYLICKLGQVSMMGIDVDNIKKYVYYGKGVGTPIEKSLLLADCEPVPPLSEQYIRVLHGVLGIISEGAELADAVIKAQKTGNFDNTNIEEEGGDVLWYLPILCDALRTNLQAMAEKNIAKLKQRYADKFSSEKAGNRNLEKERAILEEQQITKPLVKTMRVLGSDRMSEQEALVKAVMHGECLRRFSLYCGCTDCTAKFGPVVKELIGTRNFAISPLPQHSPRQG